MKINNQYIGIFIGTLVLMPMGWKLAIFSLFVSLIIVHIACRILTGQWRLPEVE
jgi:hypothetical protein